ncbi:MAG: hypothetical protein LBL09_02905 [Oscillospiraceae bacterium]|jgi:hypothetical protein|nr:hypothetical protein [Oscillospiraceae bacterium]
MSGNIISGEIILQWDYKIQTITFAANEIRKALAEKGHSVKTEDLSASSENSVCSRIVLSTREASPENPACVLIDAQAVPPLTAQAYTVRKSQSEGNAVWYVVGFDDYGTMIGGLDLSRTIMLFGLEAVRDCDKSPCVKERGIKFNIPLDARTPSYSDAGDSAQENIANMWDMEFWHEFLDEMAKNHFNVLSLWTLQPFPSMVTVPEYPQASISDVMRTKTPLTPSLEGQDMSTPESLDNLVTLKKMPIDEKIRFWQEVMEYAKSRGIDLYLFFWNMFVFGTESSGYGFTASLDDPKTKDYFRRGVTALIKTYPLLKGIGITAGENMARNTDIDESWLYDTFGEGINDALEADKSRSFCLIHRVQYASIKKAIQTFSGLNPRCRLDVSFKYSQAHVYSSSTPNYINEGFIESLNLSAEDLVKASEYIKKIPADEKSFLESIGDCKTWLTVRDDDYYMLRGGCDPEFIRTYIKTMPHEKLRGFYLGPDGYTWGREYISKDPDSPRQIIFKKRWYSFYLWGSLAYDPDIPREHFIRTLSLRFPDINAETLFFAWQKASQVIPLVNRFHNSDCMMDFQWYPEACAGRSGFHDINRFIHTRPQRNEGLIGIKDYVNSKINCTQQSGITPVELSQELMETANEALTHIKALGEATGKELRETLSDIEAMAILGKYYSAKILGAASKHLADRTGDAAEKETSQKIAVDQLLKASKYWEEYAKIIDTHYNPQTLTRLIPEQSDLPRDISVARLQADVERDIALV